MPQSSNTSILPVQNPELSQKSKSSSYNWKTLTKAGLVFVTTTGAFLALKTTGSFNLIASLWKNSPSETDLDESSALANFNNPSIQTYTAPASERQPLITHQYTKRQSSANETVIKIGPEFRANTYINDDQDAPFVVGLNDGKFIVTWYSKWQDGSYCSVYGQMYNSDGSLYGSEFKINTYTTDCQCNSPVACLSDGKFVVTWGSVYGNQDGDGNGVYGQMYNANGTIYGNEFQVNTYTIGDQSGGAIANLSDGKFVIIWSSGCSPTPCVGQDGSDYGIYGQIYNANGTTYGNEFQVNTYTTSVQAYSTVAGLGDGKFIVTWMSNLQDGSDYGCYGQMYYINGTAYENEFRINTYTTDYQGYPYVAGLSDDKFIVTWFGNGQDGNNYDIYGQMYNVNGTTFGNEFLVNTHMNDWQGVSRVAGLSDGKFIVTWMSNLQDGSSYGIYAQIYNFDGSPWGNEFRVNNHTIGNQGYPRAARLSDNKFVITWRSNGQDGSGWGIYGQMFKVDTAPVLVNNSLTVNKGERITLTTDNLSATDEDDDDSTLTFTVSNVQHGQFELKSNPGTPITTFTQQQIIDGNIQFVHDGTDIASTYQVSVDDGNLNTDPAPVTISFNSCVLLGNEFQVNTHTINSQQHPSVAGLSDGRFVVSWDSDGQDGNSTGIYSQIFNADSSKYASEFQVNTYTIDHQEYPSITGLNDNKFIVSWQSTGQDKSSAGIYNQMFNENGTQYASEFQVNTYTSSNQIWSSTSRLSDDKFVVTWDSDGQDSDLNGIFGQLFNPNGTTYSSEFQVNTFFSNHQTSSSVTGLNDGKFVVVWRCFLRGIYGQLFNPNGTIYSSEFQVNTYAGSQVNMPFVAALNDGKFIVTWESNDRDGSSWGIYGQLFNSNGTQYASEFQVNTYTALQQQRPSVACLSDGKFIVTWESYNDQDGDYGGIFGQLFYPDSSKYVSEFQINMYTTSAQIRPSVAGLNNNKFVITWASSGQDGDGYGVFGQLFKIDVSPTLVNNSLTISKGGTVTLTTDNLSATDIDDDNTTLTFTVSDVQHGQFELKSNPGVSITSFTQQQIINENIQFVHDGSIDSPSYNVAVSDGSLSTSPVPAVVTFSLIFCNEFQVNTYTTGIQRFPAVASISNSTFVVTWSSNGNDGDNYGVFGQLFNDNGSKLGDEFQVNTYTIGFQDYSRIIGLSDERFVVSWQGASNQDSYGISGQMFYTNGTKFGTEFQVNTYTTGSQECSAIAKLNDEKFIITWDELNGHGGSGYEVYGQLYHINGTRDGSEFRINTSTGDAQVHPAVSNISNDKFVVTWHSPDASGYGIFGQIFYVNGTKLDPEFQVNSYTSNYQKGPSITKLSNDNDKFVISWTSDIQDGSSWGIFGQIFNVNGTKFGSEFPINNYITDAQIYSTVVELQNGEFVVTWASTGQDGLGDGVYGQRFSVEAAGAAKRGPEFKVNTYTENNQQYPRIATLANGNLVITWMSENQDGSDYGIYAMITPPNGCIISSSSSGFSSSSESEASSSSSPVIESMSSNESKSEIVSSSSLSQSTQNETSAFSSKSSISEITTSPSVSPVTSETSGETSTPLSSSEFSLSSESKTLSSSLSTTGSTTTSSKTSRSEMSSSTSGSQSRTQSKISESVSKSTSKEISSTQALSDSSNHATTTSKSLLGIILGSIGGITSTILAFFGAWLKYKKYKTLSKMRRQNPLAAEIHKHLHLNISSFESEEGQKYLDVVKGIMGGLGKQGIATDEMDQEELRTLTLSSVKVIKDKVEPKKSWLGRKQIPVEDLDDVKDPIIKKIVRKYTKGKDKNGIKLQIMDDKSKGTNILPDDKKESTVTPAKKSGKIDPSKLGKFEKIGQGAMGIVYRAKYHGSDVAVKQLPIIAADSDELEQFEQEARLMKKLRHPHVVNFYGYYQDPTHYSIIMEYVSGGSLDNILYDTEQPFPWPTRWDVAHDIASAVSFLHSNNIIHRDLKSQNVLVYRQDDRIRAKVADVGIAKVIKKEALGTMTKGMGTPLWMAPEVIEAQGEKKTVTYDEKVDVYSYGIILSELINRKAPYSEIDNFFKVIPQVLKGKRPDFDEASAPTDFIALMQRCWTQRATERPKMQEVVDTLDRIQEEVQSFEC